MDEKKFLKEFSGNRFLITAILLIIVSGFIAYGNCFRGQLVWDDVHMIRDNVYIRSWSRAPKIFAHDMGRGAGTKYSFWRPFPIFTHLIDYQLWGLNVFMYHLVNLVIHLLVALSIYWFLTMLFADKYLSLFAGLLFVVCPVHTQVVMWIAARDNSLGLLFMLLSFIFYIKHLRVRRGIFYCIMLVSFVLALMSKESCLVLPLLLLAYHYSFKEKINLKAFISVVLVSAVYVLLRLTVLAAFSASIPDQVLVQRIAGFFAAVAGYFRLLVMPFDLRADYGNPLFTFGSPRVVLGILIVVSLLSLAFIKRKSKKVFFPLAWFFLVLAPVSNIYPLHSYMAERWFYMPSVGIFTLLAAGLSYLYEKKGLKVSAVSLAGGLVVYFSIFTFAQNEFWSDPVVFYKRIIQYTPHSPRAHNNLGNVYRERGMIEEAESSYKQAIEVDPGYPNAYNNLAFIYIVRGKYEEAFKMLEVTLGLYPDSIKAYNNLGLLYAAMGKYSEAEKAFNRALEINPDYSQTYYNLGNIYRKQDKIDRAMDFYKKTIEIDPAHAYAHNNLAVLYYYKRQPELAIRHCDLALKYGAKVHPRFLEILEDFRQQGLLR